MKHMIKLALMSLVIGASGVSAGAMSDIQGISEEWAHIKYEMPQKEREQAFEVLAKKADSLRSQSDVQAEALVWEAIVLASQAGEKGGLGALSLVKQAKKLLEEAEQVKPDALNGSVYVSLGSLYYQVPGWPLGFGNDKKARSYLEKALEINPNGIDSNFFYGDYLLDQGDYRAAIEAFNKALAAPARPDRPIADAGRRQEIELALAKAREKLEAQ